SFFLFLSLFPPIFCFALAWCCDTPCMNTSRHMDYSVGRARFNCPSNNELVCYRGGPTCQERGKWDTHPQLPMSMNRAAPVPRRVSVKYNNTVRGTSDELQSRLLNMCRPKHGKALIIKPPLIEGGSFDMRSNNDIRPRPPSSNKKPMGVAAPRWNPIASGATGRNNGDVSDIGLYPRQNERKSTRMIEAGPSFFNNNRMRAPPVVSSVTGLPFVARGPQPVLVEPTRFKENCYMQAKCRGRPHMCRLGDVSWFQGNVHTKRVISPPPSPKRGSCDASFKQGEIIRKKGKPAAKQSGFVNAFMNLFK
ncbi:hypothetical protein MOQ_006037, partial [Trypanosoma cruzi marinkellei]